MEKQFLDAAMEYHELGYSVFPVKSVYVANTDEYKKKPLVEWKELQTRSNTKEEIIKWWTLWPDAMIGIVTGQRSNLYVLDFDTEESYNDIQKFLPDSFITPIAKTPRGGHHMWFRCGNGYKLPQTTKVLPGVDSRGDGGFITAPPSMTENKKFYHWLEGLSPNQAAPQELPLNIISTLEKEKNKKKTIYRENTTDVVNNTTSDNIYYKILQEGSRSDDLFKIGICMADGNLPFYMVKQALVKLALSADPPFPLDELDGTIKSIMGRISSKERNLMDEVRELFLLQKGIISTTFILQMLQITTKREKKNLTVILSRLVDEGFAERMDRGMYRLIQSSKETMDLINEPEVIDVDLKMPLNLEDMCIISPGNIIVVAGSKSAGKTAFLMNMAYMNQRKFEIVYLNSEMHESEFKKRMKKFAALKDWTIKGYKCHNNFDDYIESDPKRIYVVDYLEVHDNFFEIAKPIRKIHEKLGDSLCFIGIQMKAGGVLGRGGDFSAEKARLYLTMDYFRDEKYTRVMIYDAKEPRSPHNNVRDMFRNVKIIDGHKMSPMDNWRWRT